MARTMMVLSWAVRRGWRDGRRGEERRKERDVGERARYALAMDKSYLSAHQRHF
jgi:hypothetical protein